jgi:hypothetical protein
MNDDQLRRLLNDAVSDVEPEDRIEELRASVRTRSTPVVRHFHARPWYAAAGIVAAVICLVAVITSVASNKSSEPGFAHPGGTSAPTMIASDTSQPSPTGDTQEYAVYYVGQDPRDRPVLFREVHNSESAKPPAQLAEDGLQTTPLDPDYSTAWGSGDLRDAELHREIGAITVTLGYPSLQHRPAGMTPAYARAAVQQVVYTLQAAFHTRLPVQFQVSTGPTPTVLGVPTPGPVEAGRVLDTLSLISVSGPNQGETVSGKLRVSGFNNGFEGSVVVHLERNGHKFLITPTIGGWGANRLFPWKVTLDLSKLTPGTYTLVASNEDASGGTEGFGPATDTRVITVE